MIAPRPLPLLCLLLVLLPCTALAGAPAEAFRAGVEAADRGDHAAAAEHWRRAARMDHADAAFRLGVLFDEGLGVEQDDRRALRWYRRAAQGGDQRAQFNLGRLYARGQGVTEDEAEAARWYERAARGGNTYAQYALGNLYNHGGPGLERDLAAAWFWLTVAAENFGANAFRDNANQLRRRAWDRMGEAERARARQRLEDWRAESG